jgi:hypothetical protein
VEIDLRRFIALFVLGAATTAAAQVTLSLGIHPDHLALLTFVAPGCAAFVVGTALAITGLLGLAEKYQLIAQRLPALFSEKYIASEMELPLNRTSDLNASERSFWRAYRHAAFALCLFITGLLVISLLLIESSFILYMTGLSVGVGVLGVIGLFWSFKALRTARRCHWGAEATCQILENQPNIEEEEETQRSTRRARWSGRTSHKGLYTRQLERRTREANRR